jgi:hypothetical protein
MSFVARDREWGADADEFDDPRFWNHDRKRRKHEEEHRESRKRKKERRENRDW